jgi:flagellar motility protein MotE (MotC chaperone)
MKFDYCRSQIGDRMVWSFKAHDAVKAHLNDVHNIGTEDSDLQSKARKKHIEAVKSVQIAREFQQRAAAEHARLLAEQAGDVQIVSDDDDVILLTTFPANRQARENVRSNIEAQTTVESSGGLYLHQFGTKQKAYNPATASERHSNAMVQSARDGHGARAATPGPSADAAGIESRARMTLPDTPRNERTSAAVQSVPVDCAPASDDGNRQLSASKEALSLGQKPQSKLNSVQPPVAPDRICPDLVRTPKSGPFYAQHPVTRNAVQSPLPEGAIRRYGPSANAAQEAGFIPTDRGILWDRQGSASHTMQGPGLSARGSEKDSTDVAQDSPALTLAIHHTDLGTEPAVASTSGEVSNNLTAMLEVTRETTRVNDTLKQSLAAVLKQNETAQQENSQMATRVLELETELAASKKQLQGLNKSMADTLEQKQSAETSVVALTEENAQLLNHHETLNNHIEGLNQRMTEVSQARDNAQKTIGVLVQQVASLEEKLAVANRKMERGRQCVAVMRAQNRDRQERMELMQQTIAASELERAQFKKEIEELNEAKNGALEETRVSMESLSEMVRTRAVSERELEVTKRKLDALREKYRDMLFCHSDSEKAWLKEREELVGKVEQRRAVDALGHALRSKVEVLAAMVPEDVDCILGQLDRVIAAELVRLQNEVPQST